MQNALEIYAQNLAAPIAAKVDEQTHLFNAINNNLLQIANKFDGLSQALDRNVQARTSAPQPPPAPPTDPLMGHPDKILKKLDKGLSRVAQELRKKMSKRIANLDSHLEHLEKYPDGKLQKVFQQEADKTWQFVDEYKVTASLTTIESEAQLAAMADGYDINAAWARLRKQHAMQCQQFLREHSQALVNAFKDKLTVEKINGEATTHLNAFFASHEGIHYSEAERRYFEQQVLDFLALIRRQQLSTSGRSKMVMAEEEKKRREALQAATAVYEAADLKTLLAMAKMHVGHSKQQSFKPGSLMHYLNTNQDTEELPKDLQDYLKLVRAGKLKLGEDGKLSGLPKPFEQGPSSSSARKSSRSASRQSHKGSSNRAKSQTPRKKQQRARTTSRKKTPAKRRTSKRASSAPPPRGRSPVKRGMKSKSPKPALAKPSSRASSRQKSVRFRRWGPKQRG
eukprot:TRINITY_DN12126_c0_g2_i2.p3 TRINITY_DN12126_c0_g2~~TRINITY_DN12126_c0_g2_i2.p3  ORF type:complete len:453 (-),score=99.04 TRINITY_DN12126_c0_g2_i2:1324-2682(-)